MPKTTYNEEISALTVLYHELLREVEHLDCQMAAAERKAKSIKDAIDVLIEEGE